MSVFSGGYKINEFLGSISKGGGMAMSNLYEVKFDGLSQKLQDELRDFGFIGFSGLNTAYAMLTLLCEEASLPGMQAMTGQTNGVYMGEGQVNYAHTRSYTDITLGWTCDANTLPVKFLNGWMRVVFPDAAGNSTENGGGNRFASTQVNYPDDYMCNKITITKAERNANATLGRVSGIYTLWDAWPYSVQATPLSYGASTLLKVTASFYYRRWDYKPENVTNPY
jgi:hypothetical protein